MAIFTGTLATDPPSDLAKLANDGRINLVSATSIRWDGSVVGLWNGSSWSVCKPATLPSAINTSTDMNGTALAVDKIYDVFVNYLSVTSCPFAFSRWAVSTAGSSARNAAYAAGTAYAIGDRVTSGGKDYTCIQAGTGQTPSSSPTYWVDNGISVTGDFAGLYRHDGVLVSHNSDAGKKLRWLGCIYTYSNSGTVNFKDEENYRYISNYYNRITKTARTYNSGSDYTHTARSYQELNNGTNQIRAKLILSSQQGIVIVGQANMMNTTGNSVTAIAIDSVTTPSGTLGLQIVNKDTTAPIVATASIGAGNHYVTLIEYDDAGTTTVRPTYTGASLAVEV